MDKQLSTIKSQYFGKQRASATQRARRSSRRELKKQNLTIDQVRDDVRASVIQNKIYEKVTAGVNVSDKDIDSYYKKNKQQYVQPASRDVRHILVKKKALADQIYQQVTHGGNFAALAKKYSTDPSSKDSGGKMTISKGRQVPEFDKVAFALKPHEVGQPVKTTYGWHVIEALTPTKKQSVTKLSEVKTAIRQQLLQQKKQDEMRKWVDDTHEGLQVEDVVPGRLRAAGDDYGRGHHHLEIAQLSLADSLLELQELTKRLRRDCPWDREQTARTIVPHTVEEAYEVADAAMADRPEKLLDELGDLLFQVYFLALLLEEQGQGDLEQAARGVHEKLVRRHPHVFGDTEARTAGRVRRELGEDQDRGRGARRDLPRRPGIAPGSALRAEAPAPRGRGRLRVPGYGRGARRPRRRAARAEGGARGGGRAGAGVRARSPRVRGGRRRALLGRQRRAAAERRPRARIALDGQALRR